MENDMKKIIVANETECDIAGEETWSLSERIAYHIFVVVFLFIMLGFGLVFSSFYYVIHAFATLYHKISGGSGQ